ncbi:unnamed protein product [Enterobius vermicularis]|uniref:Vesicular, overexpressed in cancer, prosurvival protein 1 n=1 Tax=Enterobius vermicularis TaxID=51028 RepID=A0A0N4V150_ENTVE|nr:unnamed protein product [Enterobius vermicularis]
MRNTKALNSTGFYECTGRNPRIWGENGDCAWTVGFIYGAIFSVLLFSVLFCALCCFCYSTIFGHKNFQPRHCTRSYSLEDLKISGVNESLETKGSEPPSYSGRFSIPRPAVSNVFRSPAYAAESKQATDTRYCNSNLRELQQPFSYQHLDSKGGDLSRKSRTVSDEFAKRLSLLRSKAMDSSWFSKNRKFPSAIIIRTEEPERSEQAITVEIGEEKTGNSLSKKRFYYCDSPAEHNGRNKSLPIVTKIAPYQNYMF